MQNAKWGEPLKENQVLEMSFEFAVRIVNLYKYLTGERKEYVMSKQLLRCGTSIGANVTEAQRGQNKADFYAKMCIALKEANETQYWLRLLHRTEYLNTSHFDSINTDIQQMLGLLTAICKTTESSK
jgi:four helix bundle protein